MAIFTWEEMMNQLQNEGWVERTSEECQHESSHATLCVMACSPVDSWDFYDATENPDDLPCRMCRCGKNVQHVEQCLGPPYEQVRLV